MSCTKEEIEQKRLAALQKRQSKNISQHIQTPINPLFSSIKSFSPSIYGQSSPGPVRNNSANASKGFHPYTKPENSGIAPNIVPITKVVSGTVYLISEERFEVNPSEFCSPLINVFKTIPSKSYDPQSKLWNFSIHDHEELMTKVAPLAPHVVLGPLPSYVLKVLQEPSLDPNTIDLSPVEATLRNKLMPFQQEGVRFAISRRGRCLIADDMGLGKTFQALGVASYYRSDWPLLVVTTSSMRETWQSKIHELLPSVPMMNIVALMTSRDSQLVADKQTEVVIISYKIASMHTELLKNKKFGVVIIDESHNLKSPKAQCTVSLSRVCRPSARVLLLSGTPALSRPAELYTQLAIIEPRLFSSFTEYGKRYCAGKQTNFGWDMTGQSNLTELQIILQKRFLIRRTKDQVLDMEAKTREAVLLDAALLQHQQSDLSQLSAAMTNARAQDRHAALLRFFSESAAVRIPAVCKYIKEVLSTEPGTKFLVFAHHKNVVQAVCETLDAARVAYICIVGGTPSNSRAELVDRFQHSTSCQAAVLSLTAAGAGLTLTAASLVLFAELHWNPGILTQAEARAHRLGQTGGVRVRYLIAQGTVDDTMWPMVRRKLNVLNDVGLSKDSFDDTATKHQESKTNITQYITPFKNKNDYIPGTNIRKDTLNKENNAHTSTNNGFGTNNGFNNSDVNCDTSVNMSNISDIDISFLEDDEGDELLANIDF